MKNITKQKEISLVIGSIYADLKELKILISQLNENINYFNEIICVISDVNTPQKSQEISKLKTNSNIKIDIISIEKIVMPGEARNIGIRKSKFLISQNKKA